MRSSLAATLLVCLGISACGDPDRPPPRDNDSSDDPTRPGGGGTGDILEALQKIDGLTAVEQESSDPDIRRFALTYVQPLDHGDPDGETFVQRMSLLHRDASAPLVLVTEGYFMGGRPSRVELTRALDANQLIVEHRFFGGSQPDPVPWPLLTIRQAATDLHRAIEALAPLYPEPWVSTGISKGGMTAVYHRRFFPDDVAATVAYSAPMSQGLDDQRYADFLDTVGGDEGCRDEVRQFQRRALERFDSLVASAREQFPDASFELIGGIERAVEATIVEFQWAFWQVDGATSCELLPGEDATDEELLELFEVFWGVSQSADDFVGLIQPYYVQAAAELGYPHVPHDHLADLLRHGGLDTEEPLLPEGVAPAFDSYAMADIADWVASEGERLLFLYGEFDPWRAGAFELGRARDSLTVVVPEGSHLSFLADLPDDDRDEVSDRLETWTGVRPEFPQLPFVR